MSTHDILDTPIGVIAYPYLVKPCTPPWHLYTKAKPYYSCVLQLDFPEPIIAEAYKLAQTVYNICKVPVSIPVRDNSSHNEREHQPHWFRYRITARNETMPVCLDRCGRLTNPGSIHAGDRVILGITLFDYMVPYPGPGIACRLRYVKRMGGPIKGEDV